MTYQETLDFLYQKLPMYQRVGKVAYKKDLTNTLQLLDAIGNPHNKYKTVHIAGTNGKGSSAHGIAAILQVAGYKTGLYTSPHLKNFTERIKIDGVEIQKEYVVDFVDTIKPHLELIKPSFFEITVAMAFHYFAIKEVDIAVIETGLGGRLDSTNVITPEVCLITNIGLDHTDMLGDTLEKIAIEKAGIIKQNVPVVLGEYQEEIFHVFENISEELNAPLVFNTTEFENENTIPYYKKRNESGVTLTARELQKKGFKISDDQINEGLSNMEVLTSFMGRFQVLCDRPKLIADVSHNYDGLEILFEQVKEQQEGTLHLIFGTVKDKELSEIFSLIPEATKITWTQSNVPRSLPAKELKELAEEHSIKGLTIKDVNEAIAQALDSARPEDTILVTGSTFVVAEIDNL